MIGDGNEYSFWVFIVYKLCGVGDFDLFKRWYDFY